MTTEDHVPLREFLSDSLQHERELREASEEAVALALKLQAVETAAAMEALRGCVNGMNSKLTAILVSVATAAVLLALNLIVQNAGR